MSARWWYAPAAVATAAVVALSLGDGVQLPAGWFAFAGLDKLQHGLAYFTLAWLWRWGFRQNPPRVGGGGGHDPADRTRNPLRTRGGLWVALFALGALLEVLQWGFYPARYFEVADMLANGAGAAVGLLAFTLLSHRKTSSL